MAIKTYENKELMEHDQAVENLLNYWKNIAINIFEWEGVEEISELLTSEIIETTLFERGVCDFFNDIMLGYLALPCNLEGKNVVGKPTAYMAFGYNYQKRTTPDNSVLIKNNYLMTPTAETLRRYCEDLVNIEETRKIRLDAHKTPFIIKTSKDYELTAKNLYNNLKIGKPVIYQLKGASNVGTPELDVLNTGVEYINDRLLDEYNSIVARILTFLGLDNFVEDKKERVQSAEVASQQEYINLCFKSMLEARQKACDQINKMFGLNLKIKYIQGEQIENDNPVDELEEFKPFDEEGL